MALLPAGLILLYGLSIGPKFDRYVLPAFDGYVYDAMAENPRVFTVAPWGYRILAPWIVHLLPASSSAVGYYWLTLACLGAAVFVAGAWLRRIGFGQIAAFLGGFAFAFSRPLEQMLNYQVLVDPLALLITCLILYELASPRVLVLTALFAAGALTKEACLVPALALPFAFAPSKGWPRGLLASAAVIAPSVFLALGLRATWGEPQPALEDSLFGVATSRLTESWRELALTSLLGGLVLPAGAGFTREASPLLRAQGLLMWLVTFLTILLNPYHFSAPDLPRLSAFAWPALLPLALAGFGFRRRTDTPQNERTPHVKAGLSLLALTLCMTLVAITDPFRHAPEEALKDPIRFLARHRETLKTARVIAEGGTFTFDAQSGRFAGPITERFNLTEGRNHRWFLYEGFGEDAAYASGIPEFEGDGALLVPVLHPRGLTLSLEMDASPSKVSVYADGRLAGTVDADRSPQTLRLPAASLRRGSNIVTLRGPSGTPIRLLRFEIRQETSPP